MKRIIYLIVITIFITACHKQEVLDYNRTFKKLTIVRNGNNSGTMISNIIIELNSDSTMKTIESFSVAFEMKQDFFYSSGSKRIDSSAIVVKRGLWPAQTYTEKYTYLENRLVKIFRPSPINGVIDTIELSYNSRDQIIRVFEVLNSNHGTIYETIFEYNELNLSSSVYGYDYYEFDNNKNPINKFYKQCNYPFFISSYAFFPAQYGFSENNPLRMKKNTIQSFEINQTYEYNQFGYPIEIKSNWSYNNIKFYYE